MILLGSTGSIGVNALKIAVENNIKIEVIVAGNNIKLLNEQIKLANPDIIVIKNHNDKHKVIKTINQKLLFGEDGILEALNIAKSKLVVNAIVGFSGLKPSICSLNLGKTLALANKETLAIAGSFIDVKNIIPIDSEHFSLKQLIKCNNNVKQLIITASGGALRDCEISKIDSQTPDKVLRHPTWKMGNKITIDLSLIHI